MSVLKAAAPANATVWPRSRTAWATRLLPLLAVFILLAPAQAQFAYTTNNGTITITGYTGPGGAVTIPSTITGLPVTSIGSDAFSSCTNLTNVTIPNTVTNIGEEAFFACTSLTNVTIPTSVTGIGGWAFELCGSLTSVTIPDSVTSLGHMAFYWCTNLTQITIPGSVTDFGDTAFALCSGLSTVVIENGVTISSPLRRSRSARI